MLTKIQQALGRFISTGTTPVLNELEIRRVQLLNIFFLIGIFIFLVSIVQTFIVDGTSEGLLMLSLGFIFLLGLPFILIKKTRIAEFFLLAVSNITLFIFENHHGPSAGVFLYYFPFMLIIAFLVDFKKLIDAAIHLSVTIILLILGILLRYKFLYHAFPVDAEQSSFTFNLILAAAVTAVISLIIVRIAFNQNINFIARMNERKETEETMKVALREKETLVAEVHHRVKNNLAVITSLLNLQMNQSKNEDTRNVLLESRNRVSSMALIHQKLYQHENVERIDFSSYSEELVEEIKHSYPRSSHEEIEIILTAEHLPLSLTKAVPCGLILNELLSNCYKHAFPEGKTGEIMIRFFADAQLGEKFILEVEDNGVGIQKDFEIEKQESLGMIIIQSLAGQLDGEVEFTTKQNGGTLCRVTFSA